MTPSPLSVPPHWSKVWKRPGSFVVPVHALPFALGLRNESDPAQQLHTSYVPARAGADGSAAAARESATRTSRRRDIGRASLAGRELLELLGRERRPFAPL